VTAARPTANREPRTANRERSRISASPRPLTAAQAALAAEYFGLAGSIAAIHCRERPGADRDEVESAAQYGLTLAARSFRPAKMPRDGPGAWFRYKIGRAIADLVERKGPFGDTRKLRLKDKGGRMNQKGKGKRRLSDSSLILQPSSFSRFSELDGTGDQPTDERRDAKPFDAPDGPRPSEVGNSHRGRSTADRELRTVPLSLNQAARALHCPAVTLLRVLELSAVMKRPVAGVARLAPHRGQPARWYIEPAAIEELRKLVKKEKP
jgi:hypothetical protein